MSKTAIQQAIEDIKSYRSFGETIDIRFVVRLLENVYLDVEKQQIIDAWEASIDNYGEYKIPDILSSEQYYNETYGSKGSDDQVPNVKKMVEISDEDIYKEAEHKSKIFRGWTTYETSAFIMACQWYREQLRKGSSNSQNI